MFEDALRSEHNMGTSEEHQSQELLVPGPCPSLELPSLGQQDRGSGLVRGLGGAGAGAGAGFNPEGPVNAITVLTLLDKLVNMLDTVQENQHKMEVQQVDMESVVMGIQADITKLSKNHSHTANTVSKLLDKSRKLSVTMKEVRERMERQGVQVRKLEANHAHLIQRNNFKVLIFQEESEIPSSVFVKQAVPFPRDVAEGQEENRPLDNSQSQEEGLHAINLSSDEDVGLEAELDEEGEGLHDLELMEKTRAEKIKRSSLKKVDSLKKVFSKHNIEKKMNKLVSQDQRDKIKRSLSNTQQRSVFKVSPLSFSLRKAKGTSGPGPVGPQPPEPQAPAQTGDSTDTEAHIKLSPLDLPFTKVHSLLAPGGEEEREEETRKEEIMEEETRKEDIREEDIREEEIREEEIREEEREGMREEETEERWEKIEERKEEEEEEEEEWKVPSLAPGSGDTPECFSQEVDRSALSEGVSEEYSLSATLPQGETAPTSITGERGE